MAVVSVVDSLPRLLEILADAPKVANCIMICCYAWLCFALLGCALLHFTSLCFNPLSLLHVTLLHSISARSSQPSDPRQIIYLSLVISPPLYFCQVPAKVPMHEANKHSYKQTCAHINTTQTEQTQTQETNVGPPQTS